MRVIYLAASGHAFAEKVGLGQDIIQEPDGEHPLDKDAIFKDRQREESIILIVGGQMMPLGADQSLSAVRRKMFHPFQQMVVRRSQRVSRIWSRRLKASMILICRAAYESWAILIIAMGAYIVIRLVTI